MKKEKAVVDVFSGRLEQAIRLLEWWYAANPGEDMNTRLANDTRTFLEGKNVDVPRVEDVVPS